MKVAVVHFAVCDEVAVDVVVYLTTGDSNAARC